MITIYWIIERLLVKPTEGSYTDVVITADWRCNGTETTGSGDTEQTYSGTCYGSCSFAAPTGSFTPYPDLTEQQVLGWCYQNGVDQKVIETIVVIQIANQINPPVVSLPLPWVPPTPPAPVVVAEEAPVVVEEPPVVVAEPSIVADAPAA